MVGTIINGVKFRPGVVIWEDAYGSVASALPSFGDMMEGKKFIGTKIESHGLIAKIGKYVLVITGQNQSEQVYDYTLVPFTRTKITYEREKK